MTSTVSLLLSFSFIVIECSAFSQLAQLELPAHLAKGGHYQFLTNIALVISTIYFTVNILNQLPFLQLGRLKEYLSAVCCSLNFIVTLVYWGLRFTFQNMIISSDEKRISLELDTMIHIVPVVFTWIDYLFCMNVWDIGFVEAYLIIGSFSCGYWFWLDYLLDETSSFPYPFLNVETGPRIVLFSIICLVAFGAFCIGKVIHPTSKVVKKKTV